MIIILGINLTLINWNLNNVFKNVGYLKIKYIFKNVGYN